MLITDIEGNHEYLVGYKGLKRYRNVNGEKNLSFTVIPIEQNKFSFPMVQEESIVEFQEQTYRIKQVSEKSIGKKTYKEVTAIHTFFDIIDDYIYETFTGSKTFNDALKFVFDGTDYSWNILSVFNAQQFENLGDDNRLSVFQKVIESFGAEFTIDGTVLTFIDKVGNDTDFQFRYSYNIKTLTREVNTNNLSTYIKGYGKQNEDGSYVVQSEYTSPNAEIFGIRHAKPIRDERYTTMDGLNEALKAAIIDEPEVSISIDFVDLRRAGYPYDVPNEGDRVFLIYEPMNDLDIETRIIDITEEFTEFNDYPIKTEVTLANYRKNMADTLVDFSRVSKDVNDILSGNKKLPYNVLDDAVKNATAALQSAQTELEFNNGIIAREKENPNKLVLFNSAGLGISIDGGTTFKSAITADGIVADVITAGTLRGIDITGVNITGSSLISDNGDTVTEITGGNFTSSGNFTRTFGSSKATYNSLVENYNGAFRARITDKIVNGKKVNTQDRWLVFTDKTVTTQREVHSGSIDYKSARFIDFFADETLNSDVAGLGMHIYSGENMTIQAEYGFNINSGNGYYVKIHGGGLAVEGTGSEMLSLRRTTPYTSSEGTVLSFQSSDSNWQGSVGIPDDSRNMHIATYYGDYIFLRSATETRAVNTDNSSYVPVRASSFPTGSLQEYKQDIIEWTDSALDLINSATIYSYRLISEVKQGKDRIRQGLVIGENFNTPSGVIDGDGIEQYLMNSWSWKAIQEISQKISSLEQRVNNLETAV